MLVAYCLSIADVEMREPWCIELAKTFVWVFPEDAMEKPEKTFWPTQYVVVKLSDSSARGGRENQCSGHASRENLTLLRLWKDHVRKSFPPLINCLAFGISCVLAIFSLVLFLICVFPLRYACVCTLAFQQKLLSNTLGILVMKDVFLVCSSPFWLHKKGQISGVC